jgi:hypothetical protein
MYRLDPNRRILGRFGGAGKLPKVIGSVKSGLYPQQSR